MGKLLCVVSLVILSFGGLVETPFGFEGGVQSGIGGVSGCGHQPVILARYLHTCDRVFKRVLLGQVTLVVGADTVAPSFYHVVLV